MKIDENAFQRIELEDKKIFDDIYAKYPIYHSENTFTTLFCWMDYGKYSYAVIDGSLIIRGDTEEYTSYRAPIGPKNKDLLDAVIDLALTSGDDAPFLLLEPWQQEWIPTVRPDLTFKPDRNFFEYVYLTEDLASLSGGKYLEIRKHLNRFRKKCDSSVEEVSEENMDDVHEFLIQWCQWRECDKYTILKHEKDALAIALDNYDALGLQGIAIRTGDHIGGLAIYEELNPETIVVHFEKGLQNCEGIYKEINNRTAERVQGTYRFINRECDMGVPGLREAKERYHPDHMTELYYLDNSGGEKR